MKIIGVIRELKKNLIQNMIIVKIYLEISLEVLQTAWDQFIFR